MKTHLKLTQSLLILGCIFSSMILSSQLKASEQSTAKDYAKIHYRSLESDTKIEQLPLSTEIVTHVSGIVARTQVTQTFANQTDEWLEGVYRFPLPENAAVDSLKMIIGEQVIEGEIQEKQQAERTYQTAKREGKRASLVRQERANIFTTKLANIAPQETINIQIEFQQTIAIDETTFSLRMPLGITPRYTKINSAIKMDNNDDAPTHKPVDTDTNLPQVVTHFNTTEEPDRPVKVTVNLEPGFKLASIMSDSHSIQHDKQQQKSVVRLTNPAQADRDFILTWTPALGQKPSATLLSETIGDEHYHLLMIVPPTHTLVQHQVAPREIIFVVDSSGSMSGESMQQAKSGLQFALSQLNPNDTFNIIDFDNEARKLFPQAVAINNRNIAQAQYFIDNLEAEGGTEIALAVDMALTKPQSQKLRQVIFLTDGSIGNEQEVFAIIKNKLGNNRLFTIGIGSTPNSFFMRKAAEHGRGTFTYISNIDQVQSSLNNLFKKLRYPVLRNLTLSSNAEKIDPQKFEMHPKYIRDLYLGEPLFVSYKTSKSSSDNMKISGTADGFEWSFNLPKVANGENSGIAKLWARQKIESLENEKSHDYNNQELYQTEILKTALDFHLVSNYTSLVAVDKTPANVSEKLKQLQLKNRNPAGWQAPQAKAHGYPQGGTESDLMILLGLLSLIIAASYSLIILRN